jgi:hypothetical protein
MPNKTQNKARRILYNMKYKARRSALLVMLNDTGEEEE